MTNQTDNFELIAKDAVSALTAAVLTLRIMGEDVLAEAISEETLTLVDRAIALGGE